MKNGRCVIMSLGYSITYRPVDVFHDMFTFSFNTDMFVIADWDLKTILYMWTIRL